MLSLIALFPACTHTLEFKDSGEDLECGPGTHEDGGLCVPDELDTDPGGGETGSEDSGNSAPTAPVVSVSPDDATQLSDLSCELRTPAEDPDGDEVTYTYTWFVRGVESGVADAVVPDSETRSGDTWTCRVTPSDGQAQGPYAEASVALGSGYSEVALGTYHACGLSPENRGDPGEASCWGTDLYGEGTPPSGAFVQVYGGYYESCGLDAEGALTCWGTVSWGMNSPPAGAFTGLDLGWYGAYAVAEDGTLSKWGYVSDLPAGTYSQVAGGEYDYCALDSDGLLSCWGNNNNGEGDAPAGEFVALEGGYHNFCALDTEGYPACWGFREEVLDAPTEELTALSAYDGNACGIRPDTSLVCWGDDEALVADTPEGAFVQVSVGWNAACALDPEGHLSCWGSSASVPSMR